MIECKFRERDEWRTGQSKKKKFGRYHGSYFHSVKNYGRGAWVIAVEIDILEEEYQVSESEITEVASKCVEFLNQPPKRKRKTKKPPKLPYGNLALHRAYYKEDDSGPYIMALLVTDQRKNKHFWGSGPAIPRNSRKRKTA